MKIDLRLKKRILASVCCLLSLTLLCIFAIVAAAEPTDQRIAISTKEDLNTVRNNLGASYYLTGNIVFTESDFLEGGAFYNNGHGWEPIGTPNTPFTGNFDGCGFAISGLMINAYGSASWKDPDWDTSSSSSSNTSSSSTSSVSSTSSTSSTSTSSVSSTSSSSSNSSVSSTSSTSSSSSDDGWTGDYGISDINNTGSASSTALTLNAPVISPVIGLFGYNSGTIIRVGISDFIVTARSDDSILFVGSVAGYNTGGISECYSVSAVSAMSGIGSFAGGITGYNKGVITDSYNLSTVSSSGYVGGISGYNWNGIIASCYNAGSLTFDSILASQKGLGSILGGFYQGNITNCYYLENTQNNSTGTSLTAEQMSISDNFVGFDFNAVWTISGSYQMPHLKNVTILEENTVRKGDVNHDSNVDLLDVTALSRYVAFWTNTSIDITVADVNHDGEINLLDITILSRFVAGWDITLA